MAFMDDDGLRYLWSKIKGLFNRGITALSVNGKVVTYTRGDGTTGTITTQDTNTTYSVMTGASENAAGTAGLVPAPAAGKEKRFLRGSGEWGFVTPKISVSYADNGTTSITLTGEDGMTYIAQAAINDDFASAGPMTLAERSKLKDFQEASNYALKSDIVDMYKYKGSVTDASKLPTTGQRTGDVYNIEVASAYGGAGMNVAWNGSAWDPLGEIFTITAITNAEIDAICV